MHNIYAVQITKCGAPAVVFVTAFTNADGYLKAESFCVFPPPHTERAFVKLKFNKKFFEESQIELNEEFMLEEALAQARIDIGAHIEKYYSGKAFLIPSGGLQIQEVGVSFLVHLHVREVADFLWDIRDKTECETLRVAIAPVLLLPVISHQPF